MDTYERFKETELEGYRIDDWTPREVWEEYGRRKKMLSGKNLTTGEYNKEIQKIIKELGI